MNKFIEKIIVILILSFGILVFGHITMAGSDDFNLELVSSPWHVIYGGETKTAELKIINNIGYLLKGEATFSVWYEGELFEGSLIAINPSFGLSNNCSGWIEGSVIFSDFEIPKGETFTTLKIKTHPALIPGEYTFVFSLKGTAEEEYIAPPLVIGGGGVVIFPRPPLEIPETDTGKVTATPGEGGITTLTNPDGTEIKLTIPAGAVSENTIFTVKRVDIDLISLPDPESGLSLVNGLIYEITAQRDGEFITTFDKPLILTFTYADEQIEGLVNESSLKIYWWNGKEWIALENSEVNTNNNRVTASIEHLTLFALMGFKIELIKKEKPTEEIGLPKIIREVSKKIIERVIPSVPVVEAEKPSVREEISLPREKAPQRGLASLLAAIGTSWEEISKSSLLTIVVILCLIGLALIGIREWRLFRKRKKK